MPNQCDVAIIDYGLGNLFSVSNACQKVGLITVITSDKQIIRSAKIVILPGVGAFGDAMSVLIASGLDLLLKEIVAEGKLLFCICLGMQLLMTESQEFGHHKGLNIIEGEVVPLMPEDGNGARIKVPHVGWSGIYDRSFQKNGTPVNWKGTLLDNIKNHEFMYFVHSYCVCPHDQKVILAETSYGGQDFCSVLNYKNIFACQHHPEKSAVSGLKIYENLAQKIGKGTKL